MGSPLRLQVAGSPSAARVDRAWAEVVAEFEATEQALSRYRDTSEVHRLRLDGGRADQPSRRLLAALTAADRARRVSGGRFDPRVLLDLERLGSAPIAIERPEHIETNGQRSPETPVLRRAGRSGPIEVPVPVDFGGIGKGLALRWAARRAAAILGKAPFLLEAGGDIVGRGMPGAAGWPIGIESPDGGDEPLVVLELPADGAVATSSVRRARWQGPDGREAHHLIDPRTGEPGGQGLRAVTVHGPDPAWAEVWSKSLFLEGRPAIGTVARTRGLDAWWVTADGSLEMTPGARLLTIWVAAEAA